MKDLFVRFLISKDEKLDMMILTISTVLCWISFILLVT